MQIHPLKAFIAEYFKDPADFANIHGVERDSVYRMQRNGVYASGDRSCYTLWYPKKDGGDQQNLFN